MQPKKIVCVRCKREFASTRLLFECPVCLGPLDIEYDYNEIKKILWKQDFLRAPINHFKYWPFYPIEDLTKIVSLGEGNTPLVQSTKKNDLMFKLECCNPTGSFKDRGSAIEITKALELNVKEVYCASTGNMGASVSA